MVYISHPLIKPDLVQARDYQQDVYESCKGKNSLIVLATGLGKSAVALFLIADKIQEGKCLMMAPTKPLVEQHVNYYRNLLQIDPEDIVLFTGSISPKKRKEMWEKGRLILATPQTIQNDLANGTYVLDDVSLVVFDETHRLSGDYAYGEIATIYREQNPKGQLIGMTASPGSDEEKVDYILETLGVTHIISKKDTDPDVAKYLHKKEVTPIFFDLPQELLEARNHLKEIMDGYIKQIRELNIDGIDVPNQTLSMKNLNEIKAGIDRAIGRNDSRGYTGASLYAGIMKLRHGISMAESQGILPLKRYLCKLYDEGTSTSGSKASKNLIRHPLFQRVYASALYWEEEIHPKLTHLPTLILEELDANPDAKVIIFASFRDTVNVIVSTLKEHGIAATRFVGQATKAGKVDVGLSQKKQVQVLDKFRDGTFKVLVSTSVGEEGLDIPAVDRLIFYEPTPSPVRNIQRRGRTGRHADGVVTALITKGTIDEVYWNVAKRKEAQGMAVSTTLPFRKGLEV